MQFVQHPTYAEQKHEIESIISQLCIENINKVLVPFHLHCVCFERLQTSGRINILYSLKTQTTDSAQIDLILKLSNPHRYWKRCGTQNEVYAMRYVHEKTNIPVPKVLDYSDDSSSSLLGCEFILMEKVYGHTLESVIEAMTDNILTVTIAEMMNYIRQLRELPLPHTDRIGSFISEEMDVGGLLHDGPSLVSFGTPRDLIVAQLQWSIERIRTDPNLIRIGNHLLSPLQRVIDTAEADHRLVSTDRTYRLTHTDLNPSNIIVNEQTGKVMSVLDWESAAITFDESDLNFYESWSQSDEGPERIKSLLPSNHHEKVASEVSSIEPYLDVMYAAMWATFFSCTWFDDEQMVVQHVQHYLNETEKAIAVLDRSSQ